MALTKIGSIGINTGIQFAGVTTIATLNGSDSVLSVGGTVNFVSDVSIGGTVSIAGTLTYEDVTNIDSVGLITARNGIVVGGGITLSPDGDVSVVGFSSLGTGSDGGVELFHEGTSRLSSASYGIAVNGNILIGEEIVHIGDTDTKIRFPAADTFSVETAGSERFRITSAGKVGIGTNNPARKVEIFDTAATVLQLNSTNTGGTSLRIQNSGTDKMYMGLAGDFITGQSSNVTDSAIRNAGALLFATGGGNEKVRIETAGNVKINQNLNVTGIATVGSAVTISESGIEASGIGITFANINGGKIGGRRNLIINGAMVINQRNASTTIDNGYGCDRWRQHFANTDEVQTLSQADVASGTEPYKKGFRKCLRLTNGNQTSGAGAFDYSWIRYRGEASDIITSGWDYTSSTSFLTLSFYIKSSVAQTFYGYFKDVDGSPDRTFPFETGSLSANTWKRVSVLIPGDSGLQFDNNNDRGFEIFWGAFVGTYYSSNSSSINTWKNYTDNDRLPDSTTTWYTTNDSTLEITGVQLELGTEATEFELRTFAEDYRDCLRYYYESRQDGNGFFNSPNSYSSAYFGFGLNGERISAGVRFPVVMRGIPTVTMVRPSDGSTGDAHIFRGVTGSNGGSDQDFGTVSAIDIGAHGFLYWSCQNSVTQGAGYLFHIIADAEI